MKERNKKGIVLVFIMVLLLGGAFFTAAFFLKEEWALSALKQSENIAMKSFHILGLDGKAKDPRREKEKKDLENTTAELEVLRVGEESVSFPEFAFYLLASKKELEGNFGKEVWNLRTQGKKLHDLAVDDVIKEVVQVKVMLAEAKKSELVITDEEKAEIANSVNEQMQNIDPLLVARYYLDSELISKIYEENFLAVKYYHHAIKDEDSVFFQKKYEKWEKNYSVQILEENLGRFRENGN